MMGGITYLIMLMGAGSSDEFRLVVCYSGASGGAWERC